MPTTPRQVKCPRCGVMTEYSDAQPYRPFCSERCQQIDFGAWAAGAYAIPVEDAPSSSDGSERGEGVGENSDDDDGPQSAATH